MATGDAYVSADDLALYLRMDPPAEDLGFDLMSMSVASATSWVNEYTKRDFNLAATATARYFDTTTDTVMVDDIGHATITLATDTAQNGTHSTAWATSDFQVNPLDAIAVNEPITSLIAVGSYSFPAPQFRRRGLVKVTARWGWPAVPDAIQQATLILAASLFKRHESPTGVLGGGEFGVVRVGTLVDPHVRMLLDPYRYLTLAAG
jgi:hypothetical protein